MPEAGWEARYVPEAARYRPRSWPFSVFRGSNQVTVTGKPRRSAHRFLGSRPPAPRSICQNLLDPYIDHRFQKIEIVRTRIIDSEGTAANIAELFSEYGLAPSPGARTAMPAMVDMRPCDPLQFITGGIVFKKTGAHIV